MYSNVFHMLLIIPILFLVNNRRELLKYLFNAVGIPGNFNNETPLVYSKWNTFDEDLYEKNIKINSVNKPFEI